jgi:hypothetical protein
LVLKGIDSLYFCGSKILKISGKCVETVKNNVFIGDKCSIYQYCLEDIIEII